MTPKLFSELGLSPELLKAIDKLGFEQASPIQAEAIPPLLEGRDVVGQSMTGSGKTAAFAAPAVQKVEVDKRTTQILILCPTRELAVQVSEEVHKLALFKRGLHALPVYGGQSYDRQLIGLRQGAHIVIGTPGRVMDHMRRGTLRLDTLKMVILDEVDVMLNMGFRDDIETILQATPKERQTVFFSATIPRPIQQLIEKYSRNPQQVRIEQKAMTVPTVEQCYYEVDRRYKIELLTRLIDIHDLKLGIVFCNTKRMVDDLVDALNAQGYSADRLHGDMTQAMRDRVMNKFRKSGLEFLVATDVAARGIDVDDIEVVFNFDLPYDVEDYVHRIGRTGRAGRSGRAISFAAGREVFQIRNIERYTNMRITRGKVPTAGEVDEARANVFLDKLRTTLKSGEYKKQDHLIERLLEEGFSSTDVASALLHHLQADGAAAPKAPPVEDRAPQRPERPPYRDQRDERQDRFSDRGDRDRAPRFDDRRNDRPPQRFEDRAPRPAPAFPDRPRVVTPISRPAAPVVKPAAPAPKPAVASMAATLKSSEAAASAPAKEVKASPAPAKAPAKAKEGERTYSDQEIMGSISSPEPKVRPEVKPAVVKPTAAGKRAPRSTPTHQTRLWMNLGEEMGVLPIDIVNAVSGETGLPGKVVGTIDIRERHLFVDVAAEHANAIVAKLNRSEVKGHKVKVKEA
ncbi:MAG: box helicase [Verrucomicrobiales bacterium]|nr:box helicase [Verrucomicrobiales bacterium]